MGSVGSDQVLWHVWSFVFAIIGVVYLERADCSANLSGQSVRRDQAARIRAKPNRYISTCQACADRGFAAWALASFDRF
ncbi:MAG: hypothetical protein ACPGVS_03775 [Primorskyibacter sp.]